MIILLFSVVFVSIKEFFHIILGKIQLETQR